MSDKQQSFQTYIPLLFAIAVVLGMVLGFKLYESVRGKPRQLSMKTSSSKGSMSSLGEVINYIEAQYVDTVNESRLEDDAIIEMLRGLDPHSSYIPASELQEVAENLQGNFDGIGVEFSIVRDTVVVVTPLAGGPSEALGIRAGDKIIKIEDTIVAGVGITNEKVISKLRGIKGTEAHVSIMRRGAPDLIQYDIVRDKIPIISVDAAYMLDKKTGYIKINRFSANTYDEFLQGMDKLYAQGMSQLVLDLRQNPGGYLTAAVNIVDEFIEGKRLIVYTEGRNYKRKEYLARRRGGFEDQKLVVLLDEGSASASEIVSGALQDWDRATIVGRRSFGKGLVQEQYDLPNQGALRLTIARYYTPSGRCIQKPYESDDPEAYMHEIGKRFEHGELQNPDSAKAHIQKADSVVYLTLLKKRPVYAGGGIEPDIFVPLDTSNNETFAIRTRSTIPQFVYDYYGNHQSEFAGIKDVNDFVSYQLPDAVFAAFKDHVKQELGFIDQRLLNRDRAELEIFIKAYIARQRWGVESFYPVIQQSDLMLKKALEVINSTNQ